MKFLPFLPFLLLLFSCHSRAEQAIEIGTVSYEATLDSALAKSKKSGKPVFLLFQEIPG